MKIASDAPRKQTTPNAFTIVELLATIAILAVLTAIIVPMVSNYLTQAKATANKQTLTVLNDALTRYKTQGGQGMASLTAGASIGRVLNLLKTPVTWANMKHSFLKQSTTYPVSKLKAIGEGSAYHFYAYDTYYLPVDESQLPDGEITPTMPYGKRVGYIEIGANSGGVIYTQTTSGNLAYQKNSDPTILFESTQINVNPNDKVRFWSCAGPADSSFNGDITYVGDTALADTVKVDLTQLTGLQRLTLTNNRLTQLDLSKNTNLETIIISYTNLSSIDLSQNTNLGYFYASATISYNSNLTSVTLGSKPLLYTLYVFNNPSLNTLDISSCPQLRTVHAYSNNLSSINISGNALLDMIRLDDNNLSSLDISPLSNLNSIYYNTNPFVNSATELNAFYQTIPDNGGGTLGEVAGATGSDSGNGNTALIPAGWTFW